MSQAVTSVGESQSHAKVNEITSEWYKVLAEVRELTSKRPETKDKESSWYDLAEDASTSSSDKPATPRWQQHDWARAFNVLVFHAPPSALPSEQQDDLLFFVYLDAYQGDTPYIVRRRGKALPVDLLPEGPLAHQIDWKRTVLLNLVTQTSYSMTVAACPRERLHSVGSHPPLQGIIEVRKAVYASTTKSQLNLTNRKMEETNPTMTFPDMSFAVDNFEEAFDSLLLTQHEHCYLVLLTATGGMALRNEQPIVPASRQSQPNAPSSVPVTPQQPAAATDAAAAAADTAAASLQHPLSSSEHKATVQETASQAAPTAQQVPSKGGRPKERILFSGFVSYEQLEQKLLGPKKGPWWLQKPLEGPHPVRMRGPGGTGCADVAVTCLARAHTDSPPSDGAQGQPPTSPSLTWEELRGGAAASPSPPHKQRQGLLGSAIGAAAHVVKLVANTSPEKQNQQQMAGYDMRCALMNLILPMESLAQQLLQ